MFERFTSDARAAVTRAVEEAERRGDPKIGTEHLLLGVSAARLPFDRRVLGGLDVTPEDLRRILDEVDGDALASVGLDPGLATSTIPMGSSSELGPRRRRHLPFTRAAKAALEETLRQALATGDRHLGPEHMLLALLGLPAGDPVSRVIERLEVDRSSIRGDIVLALRRAS